MKSLSIRSPAKLNLYLRVTGKLPGGYHSIHTIFHRISLCDEMILRPYAGGFRLHVSDPALPSGCDNLIARAYHRLREKCPRLPGVLVHLKKRIPLSAGLGGGSSNAAFFLLGMNRFFDLNLPFQIMRQIGEGIGSDIVFFLHEVMQAVGTGRGNDIRKDPQGRLRWFVIVTDPAGLSTRKVYESLGKARPGAFLTTPGAVDRIARSRLNQRDLAVAGTGLWNDLEEPAVRLNPSIQKTMALMLQLGCPAVAMSGSGPTVFAMWNRKEDARGHAKRLENFFPRERLMVCRSY